VTPRRRETLFAVAFAVWGLAIGIALYAVWNKPAPADQLPGMAKALGIDAHGPFRWLAGMMLLPILLPLALRPIARRLIDAQAWARNAVLIAPVVTLWLVTVRRDVFWTIVPCALVLIVCTLLRHRVLAFTRRDVVLLAAFLPTLLALGDIGGLPADAAVYVAALLIFALRIGITFLPSTLSPALAFVAAPLALVLQTGFFARDQRYFGWHALAFVLVTPIVLRLVVTNARRATALLVFATYPVTLYSYASALHVGTAEGKPRISFFEDGHSLLPASEYLRGERPYRDMLPAHGLVEDGLFDYAAMRLGGVNAGVRSKARSVVGHLVAVALYFVAFAATGSAEAAFLAVLLSFLTGAFTANLRFLFPFATLAALCAAARRRSHSRLYAVAGFGIVLCGITSLDFAAYTFLTLIVAVLRSHDRRSAMKSAALGIAAATIPLFITLAAFGILGDFVRGTFVETLSAGPAYTLNFFTPPALMVKAGAFPDILAAVLDREVFEYIFWCLAAIFTGVTVTRAASRRLEPVILLGVWIVATGISYAERHHLYFGMLAAVLVVYTIRRLPRMIVPIAILATIALAGPTTHIGVIGWMREARAPLDPAWVELPHLPRARGALFHESDARFVAGVERYLSLALPPGQTFFDFTNSGILYYLFRRDCPIREYETPFYESEEQQREVIRRLEANPNVRAALIPRHPHARFTIDHVPNAERAPLVWAWLQENFHPDFEEGEVVFWRRN
jgi:hypothetical protein